MFKASDVKELREKTGAGMLDCKKALEENNGDMEKAIDWLREKGIAKAAKKESRIAAEGLCQIKVEGNTAVILEVTRLNELLEHSSARQFERLKEEMEQEVAELREYKERYRVLIEEVEELKIELENNIKNSDR